jgi:ribosomal protein S18 acetylase RimI-like enzyme
VATINIHRAIESDADALWGMLEPVIRAGETYALPEDLSRADALAFWMASDHEVFIACDADAAVGTYFLCANRRGGGSHVANCGYITATTAQGRGVARAMCAHSLERARARGFLAMQFNFVVSSNERAVRLWRSFGFEIVGRLSGAFRHPRLGLVDVYVMYLKLAS